MRELIISIIVLFLFSGIFLVVGYFYAIRPPSEFPKDGFVSVKSGDSLRRISKELANQNIIRVPTVFEAIIIFSGMEKSITAGDYAFSSPMSVIDVASRFLGGRFGGTQIKITLPEGLTRTEMSEELEKKLPKFNAMNFLSYSQADEGYLFPDTYFFFKTNTETEVLTALRENFKRQTEILKPEIENSNRSLHEIITMASLIEKEAKGDVDREEVAKILWRRLEEGKLLQVDAPFLFLLNKESKDLTISDLNIDSPYNTYKYKGLPPGPIGNPGILAIKAALTKGQTPYLFYLHGDDGIIHFAKTFEEHKKNKKLYLK